AWGEGGGRVGREKVGGVYGEMEERVVSSLERQGVDREDIAIERLVDLRYIGQLHSVTVPLPEITDAGVTGAVTAFHDEHLRQYRYSHPDAPVETSTLRVAARGTRAKPHLRTVRYAERDTRRPAPDRQPPVHFGTVGWLDTRVVDRLRLVAGDEVEGACVVEELDSTLVLAPGMRGRVDEVGNIVIALERNAR